MARRVARWWKLLPLTAFVSAATLAASIAPASAAAIVVTSASPGTGGPDCTLRDAITAANTDAVAGGCAAGSGADTITLAVRAAYTLTDAVPNVVAAGGVSDITTPITINGNGAVVERSTATGTPEFRLFTVNGGALTLHDLTVRNGRVGAGEFGGGLLVYRGTATLDGVTFTANAASAYGGGVVSAGTLVVVDSTISANASTGVAGGIANNGGAATITSSTFTGNSATQGGALYASGASTAVTNSTFHGNNASSNGGGIAVATNLSLNNSTVSGNTRGGLHMSGPTVVHNTVVAAQTSGLDCASTASVITIDASNVDTDGTCGSARTFAAPGLGPLADNGGPTRTRAVQPSSPLIDTGTAPCPATDQRHSPRPLGFGCDVGAFEFVPVASTTVVAAANAVYDGTPHGGTAIVTDPFGLSESLPVTYTGRNATVYGPSTTPPTAGGEYRASASYPGGPNSSASNGSANYAITAIAVTPAPLVTPASSQCRAATPAAGFRLAAADGGVFSFGTEQSCGAFGATAPNRPIVGLSTKADGNGYWLVAADGGIFSFGDAKFHGSTGALRLNQPVIGIAATPTGNGYWLAARDGGIFSFGDAKFHGSTGALRLNQPVVGIAATPTGNGYWLVAADGGIFSFGDAKFHGSTGALRLNQPVIGIAATPTGNGYWLAARDGGIFSFGDAKFHGSTGALRLNQPVIGIAATPTGNGYWLAARDGGIFSFGNAAFHGSTGAQRLNQPIVAIG